MALAPLLSGGTRVRHWQSARRLWPDTRRQQLPLDDCCRLVLPYNAVHSIQQTEQIPNDPPRMGAKSTTTSSHPSAPNIKLNVSARCSLKCDLCQLTMRMECVKVVENHWIYSHQNRFPKRYIVILALIGKWEGDLINYFHPYFFPRLLHNYDRSRSPRAYMLKPSEIHYHWDLFTSHWNITTNTVLSICTTNRGCYHYGFIVLLQASWSRYSRYSCPVVYLTC